MFECLPNLTAQWKKRRWSRDFETEQKDYGISWKCGSSGFTEKHEKPIKVIKIVV